MFIKNTEIKENKINESVNITDSNLLYAILESNEMMHNITMDMIRVEHNAIVNESEELLNEGVKETAKKFAETLKKLWIKVRDWFINTYKYFAEKDTTIKAYFKAVENKITHFEGTIEVEVPNMITENYSKLTKASEKITSLMNEKEDGFDKAAQIKEDLGVDSFADFDIVDGTITVKVDAAAVKKLMFMTNGLLDANKDLNKSFKAIEKSYKDMISSLENISSANDEEDAKRLKNINTKKAILDYFVQVEMLAAKYRKINNDRTLKIVKAMVAASKSSKKEKTSDVETKEEKKDEKVEESSILRMFGLNM